MHCNGLQSIAWQPFGLQWVAIDLNEIDWIAGRERREGEEGQEGEGTGRGGRKQRMRRRPAATCVRPRLAPAGARALAQGRVARPRGWDGNQAPEGQRPSGRGGRTTATTTPGRRDQPTATQRASTRHAVPAPARVRGTDAGTTELRWGGGDAMRGRLAGRGTFSTPYGGAHGGGL